MRTTLVRYPQSFKAVSAQSRSGRVGYGTFFQVSAAVFKIRYEEVAPGSW
jgi:hypothetical protein